MRNKIRLKVKSDTKNENEHSSLFESKRPNSNTSSKRRTGIHSFGDILDSIKEAGREGLIPSIVSRKANLAYNLSMERCEKLISAGLIETKIIDKKKVYIITEKGLDFFQEYEKFQGLAKSLNLRY